MTISSFNSALKLFENLKFPIGFFKYENNSSLFFVLNERFIISKSTPSGKISKISSISSFLEINFLSIYKLYSFFKILAYSLLSL